MNTSCANCGAHIESLWSFCPHCGAAVPDEVHETQPAAAHPNPEKVPVKGAFGGLLLGFISAPVLIVVGSLLLITGVGALPGFLMIVGGILAPLLGPMLGIGALHGNCPWCGAEVRALALLDRFSCESCKGKIQVRHREMEKAA